MQHSLTLLKCSLARDRRSISSLAPLADPRDYSRAKKTYKTRDALYGRHAPYMVIAYGTVWYHTPYGNPVPYVRYSAIYVVVVYFISYGYWRTCSVAGEYCSVPALHHHACSSSFLVQVSFIHVFLRMLGKISSSLEPTTSLACLPLWPSPSWSCSGGCWLVPRLSGRSQSGPVSNLPHW